MTNTIVRDILGYLADSIARTGCAIQEKEQHELVVELPSGKMNKWTGKNVCLHIVYDEKKQLLVGVYNRSAKPTEFTWPDSEWRGFARAATHLIEEVANEAIRKLV